MLFRTSDGSGHRSSAGCLNLPRSNLWAIRLPAGGTPSSVLGYRLRTLSSPSRRKAPKPVCREAVRIQLLAGPSGYSTFALRFGVQSRERQRTANKLALGISVANVWIVGVAAERSVNRSASGTDRHTTNHRKSLQFNVL